LTIHQRHPKSAAMQSMTPSARKRAEMERQRL
jgi:hypothetical protein